MGDSIGQDILQSEKLFSTNYFLFASRNGFSHLTECFFKCFFLQLVNVFKILKSLHIKPKDESYKEPLPSDLWIHLKVNSDFPFAIYFTAQDICNGNV